MPKTNFRKNLSAIVNYQIYNTTSERKVIAMAHEEELTEKKVKNFHRNFSAAEYGDSATTKKPYLSVRALARKRDGWQRKREKKK